MPNRPTDELFQLIKSLDATEKRIFRQYANRNSNKENLNVVSFFDALDKMEEFDEEKLLKKNKAFKKQQLSNMKAHLYKQLLNSLRLKKDEDNIDIHLTDQMNFARILYNKGLYFQALKILDKLKQTAKAHHQVTYQLQALIFEKKIEALHITRSIENRAEQLSREVNTVNNSIALLSRFSNLALQLYSWYIKNGHARNEKDVMAVKVFFESHLPEYDKEQLGFYEKLYLFQAHSWYGFILQDFLLFYRYTQKWVDLFEQEPFMRITEAGQYIKAVHNLLSAHFVLGNYEGYLETLRAFDSYAVSNDGSLNINTRMQVFIYLQIAKVNKHFLEGSFSEGLALIPEMEDKLTEYSLHIDRHRLLILYYKIACLYFGSGDNERAIDYLNKIINWKVDLRTDLQCYARLLHLIAHYELGNYDLIEYLIKSVYRFLAKMENLSVVEEEIFHFLRKSFALKKDKIIPAFKALKEKLEKHKRNTFETRSFLYLDIIGWLESKIENIPVQQIISNKFLNKRKIKS